MAIHTLKIEEKYALLHLCGVKPWEIRKFDKPFKNGDTIVFKINGTDKDYARKIIYVYSGTSHGLKRGYCIISLSIK